MATDITTIERAFELAKSGACRDCTEIERTLQKERFQDAAVQMRSASLRKQLSKLCLDARQDG